MRECIKEFEERGIKLWVDGDKLRYKASRGSLETRDIEFLKKNKLRIIQYLNRVREDEALVESPQNMFEPFPQNDIQLAYSMGKSMKLKYGGVCCHTYMEIEYSYLEAGKVQMIFNELIKVHPMLHAVIQADGTQRVLETYPQFRIEYHKDKDFNGEIIKSIRSRLSEKFYPNDMWPQFDIAVTELPNKSILHFSMEFIIADWTSMWMLLYQFEQLYFEKQKVKATKLSFRDCAIYQERQKLSAEYLNAKNWWMKKIEQFSFPPALPIYEVKRNNKVKFRRLFFGLDLSAWKEIVRKAGSIGVTPTALVLAVYGYTVQRWSENKRFAINVTLLNRNLDHPDIMNIVGDFTTIIMHQMEWRKYDENKFEKVVKNIQQNLFDEIDHSAYSGVEFLRELAKNKGENLIYPIAFTSALGIANNSGVEIRGKYVNGLTQTPQVIIDCQVMDGDFGVNVNWDIREGVFKYGIIEDMFDCFKEILSRLANENFSVDNAADYKLPLWQLKEREDVNKTINNIEPNLLHHGLLTGIVEYPDRIMVAESTRKVTYREMGTMVKKVVTGLKHTGIGHGSKVGIMMNKSLEQIAAVLGVLFVNAVYVPIDLEQGNERIQKILESAKIELIITDETIEKKICKSNCVKFSRLLEENESALELSGKPDDTAYIIFTSGSTGSPKGVEVSHAAAFNTISDVVSRFGIKTGDSVLAISKLNFDLSVFDIFGMLYIGGKIVIPTGVRYLQPELWNQLIKEQKVTLWNSVPSLMEIYVEYLKSNSEPIPMYLKQIWLSGDWIKMSLWNQIQEVFHDVKVISMGGATEAAIWSIYHICDESDNQRKSIPYGRPLGNQYFAILDENYQHCPVGVVGELYIMGKGLAKGYYGDDKLTGQKFVKNRETGELMYATGDMGRYQKGGEIEFLGRNDFQVKVNGNRIELGEIEHIILKNNKVRKAVAMVYQNQIVACVCGEAGIEKELLTMVQKNLPTYMVPRHFIFLNKMPITSNGKLDQKKLIAFIDEHIKDVGKQEEMWSKTEQQILKIFEEVLEQHIDHRKRSFYDYGADSLSLSRAVNKILNSMDKKMMFDELLAQIMNYPTIEATAKFLEMYNN